MEQRTVSTDPSGRDIGEKPTTTRQRAEVAMHQTRKDLQEHRVLRSIRRQSWEARLRRRSLLIEREIARDRGHWFA
jgi:hypothetical protein